MFSLVSQDLLAYNLPVMRLSREQVRKVAKLANLNIPSEQEEKYSEQLSAILDYIDQLNEVNTENVEPTFNVSKNENKLREDEVRASLAQEEAIQNGSKTRDGFFVTKGVFADE